MRNSSTKAAWVLGLATVITVVFIAVAMMGLDLGVPK